MKGILLTNLHLPRSTLLTMVCTFAVPVRHGYAKYFDPLMRADYRGFSSRKDAKGTM